MLAYLFVILAVLARMPFIPHPWNFTPVAAALLYFGARGSRRQLWVPFALLAASDVILTKFVYYYPLTWDQLVVCLVCGDSLAGYPVERKRQLAADRRSRARQFRLFLRCQ